MPVSRRTHAVIDCECTPLARAHVTAERPAARAASRQTRASNSFSIRRDIEGDAGCGARGSHHGVADGSHFYVQFAPFIRLACEQTNYRAYVRCGDERVVWFFGTALASPFVMLPRHAWQLPWHRMHVARRGVWRGDALTSLDWHARAEGAGETLRVRGTGRALHQLDGFADVESTHRVLTHPTRGFLRTRRGRIVTYGVWHAPLVMEEAEVDEARFERFEKLGLVQPGQAPHSVLVQRTTDFLVRLPPRRVQEVERLTP